MESKQLDDGIGDTLVLQQADAEVKWEPDALLLQTVLPTVSETFDRRPTISEIAGRRSTQVETAAAGPNMPPPVSLVTLYGVGAYWVKT